ncbi:MAG: PEP-CTERM sorting domain-containing protein [Armatimonas sp.]
MKPNRSILSGALSALCLVALTSGVHADVIYSNLGPGDSFSTTVGWNIRGAQATVLGEVILAASFTPTQNYVLSSFELPGFNNNGTNSYQFSIVADNGGLPIGAEVVSPFTSSLSTTFDAVNSFGVSGSVTAGQKYWLIVGPGAGDTNGVWWANTTGATGLGYRAAGGGWTITNDTSPAFRIQGNLAPSAPEPGTLALFALGGLLLSQRKKRAATKPLKVNSPTRV